MKRSTGIVAICLALAVQGTAAGLFGLGLIGFKTVDVQPEYGLFGFGEGIPLAEGLSLSGTTGYSKLSPSPSPDCLTTSLGLFTSCQPFLTALVQNGGGISKPTILALLQTAQNKTADVACANSVLNFLNEGCVCSLTVYNTVQAFPSTTVPQLLKEGINVLAKLLCPTGLVTPAPPAAATATSTAAGTMSMVPLATAG